MTIKNTLNGVVTYTDLLDSSLTASNNTWLELKGDYTYNGSDQIFLYVKGPTMANGGGDFYIDDFSLVPQGSSPVDFSDLSNVVDIGAYEYDGALSLDDNTSSFNNIKVYPNPAKNVIILSGISANSLSLIHI